MAPIYKPLDKVCKNARPAVFKGVKIANPQSSRNRAVGDNHTVSQKRPASSFGLARHRFGGFISERVAGRQLDQSQRRKLAGGANWASGNQPPQISTANFSLGAMVPYTVNVDQAIYDGFDSSIVNVQNDKVILNLDGQTFDNQDYRERYCPLNVNSSAGQTTSLTMTNGILSTMDGINLEGTGGTSSLTMNGCNVEIPDEQVLGWRVDRTDPRHLRFSDPGGYRIGRWSPISV